MIDVDPAEPHAGNALALNGSVLFPASFPKTRARIEAKGFRVLPLDIAELQKRSPASLAPVLFRSAIKTAAARTSGMAAPSLPRLSASEELVREQFHTARHKHRLAADRILQHQTDDAKWKCRRSLQIAQAIEAHRGSA